MSSTQQREQNQTNDKHDRAMLNALIAARVIQVLGKPDDLLKVQVRHLWENHYRVNILVGADATSPKFANSYFLVADKDGNITDSTPQIKKQYQGVAAVTPGPTLS